MSRRSRHAGFIEALESRRLLAVFNGTEGNDVIFVQMQGADLLVGIQGGNGQLYSNPASLSLFINGLGGNDVFHINRNGGASIWIDGGTGDDQIGVGSAGHLDYLPGPMTLTGGSGYDRVFTYDDFSTTPRTYTVTNARFDRPGWGGFYYSADLESLKLNTGQGNDTVNVTGTFSNQPVTVTNIGGADTIFVGHSSIGVQGVSAHLFIEGTGGTNTIYISNAADTIARSATIDWDVSSSWGALNSLAPFPIIWKNANTTQVTITTGTAADSILVNRNSSPLVLNSAGGNDTVQIGSPLANGLTAIFATVQIENNPAYTNLVITNQGDVLNRTWTIDSANGYGSLVGMAPATIYWDNADIAQISLICGLGTDTGTIKRLSETLNINNSTGSTNTDTITIGDSDAGGVQQITGGGITIDNSPWYTDITIDNQPDGVARNITLDLVNGYNVLTGLAPATIRYDSADTKNVTIQAGNGLNTFNVLRTATAGGATYIRAGNSDASINVGNTTEGLQSIFTTLWIDSVLNLTLDNRADTVARNITNSIPVPSSPWGLISGLAPRPLYYHCAIAYFNGSFASLRLLGGTGGNTYTIDGTSDTGAFRKNWRLDTSPGDFVNVNTTNMPSWAESRVELIDPAASLASLTIQNNASVELAGPADQVLVTGSINLMGTGTLDVRDKSVIVNYSGGSPIGAIGASITSGYNAGAWTGPGIRSSAAATTPGTAVGFAEATDLFTSFPATFAGQSIDSTAVLIRHTLNGDANLDRATNLADFNVLASNFGQSARRWGTGDFSFDALADLNDFNLLAGQFGNALAPGTFGQTPIRNTDDVLFTNPTPGELL